MASSPPAAICVFCGAAIGPDEPMAGRPPMAAHSACADLALADDRHWDAVAGGDGSETEETPEQPDPAPRRRSAGCLTIAGIAATLVAIVAVVGCAAQTAATPTPSTLASSAKSASAAAEPHVTAMPAAPPSHVVLHVVAENVRWDADTLAAPAGMTWTVELENRDGPPEIHNFAIVDGPAVTDRIFMTTPNLQGPATESYEIPGLPAGSYEFVCTLHPDGMRGVLIVE